MSNEIRTTVATINNFPPPRKKNMRQNLLYISVKVIIKALMRESIFGLQPIFCIGLTFHVMKNMSFVPVI